jgi:glycosyltransferase involved in cell wall biosynthesis
MNLPKVSVIMPAYNVAPYIGKAIECILQQTYANFELIISDDSSKDNTLLIIDKYNDPRIRVLKNEKNLGYAANMNLLFLSAKGEFIMLQDSDDYCTNDRIEKLATFLIENPAYDGVGSSYVKFDGNGIEETCPMPTDPLDIQNRFDNTIFPLPVLNGTIMVRDKVVKEKCLFRDLKYIKRSQDDDWLFRLSENYSLSNVSDVLYYYRTNLSSMTLNPNNIDEFSFFSRAYVLYLRDKRINEGYDPLEAEKWTEIENFFKNQRILITEKDPAFFEIYKAHKYLAIGEKRLATKLFFAALKKDFFNLYIWKKTFLILFNKI